VAHAEPGVPQRPRRVPHTHTHTRTHTQWAMLSRGSPSGRSECLLIIDPVGLEQDPEGGTRQAAIRVGDLKLIVGNPGQYIGQVGGRGGGSVEVCLPKHTHTHAHTHAYTHARTHARTHTHAHTQTQTQTRTHTHLRTAGSRRRASTARPRRLREGSAWPRIQTARPACSRPPTSPPASASSTWSATLRRCVWVCGWVGWCVWVGGCGGVGVWGWVGRWVHFRRRIRTSLQTAGHFTSPTPSPPSLSRVCIAW
jgi:hypothetical protein